MNNALSNGNHSKNGSVEEALSFVLEYDPREFKLLSLREYSDPHEAHAEAARLEQEHGIFNPNPQILMLGASSLDVLRQTHPHYFQEDPVKENPLLAEVLDLANKL